MKAIQTVLMIDDDTDDQEIFREVLYAIDPMINSLQALSAKFALDLLLEDHYKPDFIFLDLNMPAMNGFEFLEAIREHNSIRHIPVIVYTTSTHSAQKEKAKLLGASDFITKPTDLNSLKTILEGVLLSHHSL